MKLELKKDELLKKLLYSTGDEFEDLIEKIHPADILDILHENSDRLYEILERLPDWLIADILEEEEETENLYSLYVVDKRGILKGVVSLKDIVCSSFNKKINDILNENVITVPYNMDQEEVAKKFDKYVFLTIPVVDEENKILGIITVDDIVEILCLEL